MSNTLRNHTSGGSFFFTLRLADRCSDLLIREVAQLRTAMRETKAQLPFEIEAITVLPATLHMIWTLPEGDSTYASRVAKLKSRFSRAMPMPAGRSLAQIKRGEKGIWQRHNWEHQIQDDADFERHRDLIYLSPVHAGLCPQPHDWTHTSLHRDLRMARSAPALPSKGAGKSRHIERVTGAPEDVVVS